MSHRLETASLSEDAAFIFDWSKIPGGPPPEHLVLEQMAKIVIAVAPAQDSQFASIQTMESAA